MATPLTADALVKALRDEGLTVIEHRSWRTHNRNHKGPWGPVHGVMIHHTVTSGTSSSVELCYNGHSTLPGPLCHGVIAKDGSVYLVGNGRTNHAGLGDDDVLRAVVAGQPLPADNEANTDGNRHFYGFECINLGDGKDPWPAAQLEAIEKASAAICRAHQWTERSVIGHLEWQPGKIDPRGFTMASMRARVAERLTTQEDDMTPEQSKQFAELYRDRQLSPWQYDGQLEEGDAWQLQKDTARDARAAVDAVAGLSAKVDALQTNGLTDTQMNRLAELVADKLAARLAD